MNKESSKSHVRSMRREISRYMILIIAITLAMVYGLTIFIMYREMSDLVRDQITQEADYIAGALNVSGQGYMRELDQALVSTRVTLISEDGDVLYDTDEEEFSFENHLDRPEIREALEKGRGTDLRRSSSIGEEMYYCAVLLEDGNVLRISKSAGTPWAIALRLLPAILLIGAAMVVAAALMTGYSVRSLIRPINLLDLNEPLKNDVYEELTPLLQRIDRQNREKEAVGEMRMEFSANVSHELKTPLTSISGYAEIMKNGLVKPADTVRFAEKIYREAGRMITLIDDIIRLSRLDEGIRSGPDPERRPLQGQGREADPLRGRLQPGRQCHQIQPSRRQRFHRNGLQPGQVPDPGEGYGHRHSRGPEGADLRALLPGGQEPFQGHRRNGPGPVHRKARRLRPPRPDPGGLCPWEGDHHDRDPGERIRQQRAASLRKPDAQKKSRKNPAYPVMSGIFLRKKRLRRGTKKEAFMVERYMLCICRIFPDPAKGGRPSALTPCPYGTVLPARCPGGRGIF